MANLPRFGRARQRLPTVAPPVPAAAQPIVEPMSEILQTLQPLESTTPTLASPPKKVTSPKYGASDLTRVDSPPASKATRSLPDSPTNKYLEKRNKEITSPPLSPAKSRLTKTPPLSPLALPRSQVISGSGNITAQPRIQPEVETKGIVYNKAVEKPTKSDRMSEYGSGKPQQAEVINLNGHNVGAVMEINKSSDGYRLGGETVKKNETEGDSVRHGHEEKKTAGANKEPPMTAFMNTNFQSVNNSVLYDSSCNHRDPGLHLAFSDAAEGHGATVDGHKTFKPPIRQ